MNNVPINVGMQESVQVFTPPLIPVSLWRQVSSFRPSPPGTPPFPAEMWVRIALDLWVSLAAVGILRRDPRNGSGLLVIC